MVSVDKKLIIDLRPIARAVSINSLGFKLKRLSLKRIFLLATDAAIDDKVTRNRYNSH